MGKHIHTNAVCAHEGLEYCQVCDEVTCKKCDKNWYASRGKGLGITWPILNDPLPKIPTHTYPNTVWCSHE